MPLRVWGRAGRGREARERGVIVQRRDPVNKPDRGFTAHT